MHSVARARTIIICARPTHSVEAQAALEALMS